MKTLLSALLLLASLSSLAQTSSRFRNEVVNSVNQHVVRIDTTCTETADRLYNAQPAVRLNDPSSWLYKYEVFYLNHCYFRVKMRLMDNHKSLAQNRITRLSRMAADRADQQLRNDVRALRTGLTAFSERQQTERRRFETEDYGWLGQEDITKLLQREIKRVLNEYYEMKAEMRFEGTL